MLCIRSLTDRTKASDAFNAGSIPVGCILHHPVLYKVKKANFKRAACGFLHLGEHVKP